MNASGPIAVSTGDPAGIGPELIADCWLRRSGKSLPTFFVAGGSGLLAQAARSRGLDLAVQRITHPDDAAAVFAHALPVLGDDDAAFTPGNPDPDGARFALASLQAATDLTVSGTASGLVTGPIAKARLAEIGFTHPGQTEFVAHACGIHPGDSVMMLAGPGLRTVPLTVHMPLAKVPDSLSEHLIERKGRIVAMAMIRDFGIAQPRLAFAGLNPHAGEDGRMGEEESRFILPALARLQAEGIDAQGPYPADSLFSPRMRETYDVALCMYHDQALIPLKALHFDQGVNITLGLPVVRTSPDHGTAFAIAGKGVADAGAMAAAMRMAGDMVHARAVRAC